MKNTKKITGIILCGGKSRRMGNNKAFLKLNGKYIVSHVFEVLSALCKEIIISTNTKELAFLKGDLVADEFQNIGPIAGIYSALKHSKTEKNIILSCDTPFINTDILEYLLKNSENFDVVLPVFEDFLQPLTGIFNKTIIPIIENEITKGNYIPPRIFEKTNLNKLKIDKNIKGWHKHLFFNVNSPEDYEKAKLIIQENKIF
jgi:molybdopterin-guanine dinucleotide biosynthesis protein A